MIYTNCERNMGARDLDWNLLRVFAEEYKEENGEDPLEKPRTIVRLLDEVEKVRRKLTSNEDIEVSIESLMSEDFERPITRQEFTEYNIDIKDSIVEMLTEAKQIFAGEDYVVELVGEATRMPFVEESVR